MKQNCTISIISMTSVFFVFLFTLTTSFFSHVTTTTVTVALHGNSYRKRKQGHVRVAFMSHFPRTS